MRPEQHRAADLLGRGIPQKEVATELGVTPRTVRRWVKSEPGFAEAVQAARDRQLKSEPTALDVLRAALHATKRDGQPDWNARIQSARLILADTSDSGDADEVVTETVIHAGKLADG